MLATRSAQYTGGGCSSSQSRIAHLACAVPER